MTADTPFDVAALAALLPGYDLAETPSPDDLPFRQIVATGLLECRPLLIFLGHADVPTITGVRVREPGRIPNAWMIGSRMDETLIKPADCFTAQDVPGREGHVFAREAGQLTAPVYWFDTGLANTGGVLPDPDTLKASTLYEISWVAWKQG